jgi:hypothetical protein
MKDGGRKAGGRGKEAGRKEMHTSAQDVLFHLDPAGIEKTTQREPNTTRTTNTKAAKSKREKFQ